MRLEIHARSLELERAIQSLAKRFDD
jgi:hypothetical protein